MKKPKLAISGLNPAWQKTISFHNFIPGAVNRAAALMEMASGKGINTARAAINWGCADPVVFQVAGGMNGERLVAYLNEEGLPHQTLMIPGNTRCCTTILDRTNHTMTELIEPSAKVPESSVEELFRMFDTFLPEADALALCGTYPPGIPEDFYARLAAAAKKHKSFLFLDAFIGIEKILQNGVDLLKINLDELYALTGENNVENAFAACFRKFKVGALAVTDGKNPAFIAENGHNIESLPVPIVEKPVNPIGSGDTCSGVTLSELMTGTPLREAFRCGLAAASANCLTEEPATFDRSVAKSYL